ncbi:MAG TPA: ribose-phosphate diphosphokinase, partial [Aggregatilineales bacterium]|nr:ribose-phosphate diphosphokinase [Aggregatilineales bacterium]
MATHKVPGTKYIPPEEPPDSSRSVPGQYGGIRLLAGSASGELGAEIAQHIHTKLSPSEITRFSNENILVKLKKSVRGQDVYLVQSMASPVSDNIMELLITLDTLKRDSAGRITAVIPYLAYGRSDKKDQPRIPITSRMLADMIQMAGADRYITIDLHAGQIQGFFSIPGDVLTAFHLVSDYIFDKRLENAAVVSTDLGFAKNARNYAAKLNMKLAFIEKRRMGNKGQSEVLSLIGDIRGMDAVIIDDECDTGGSLKNAVETVRESGAKDVYLAFTHAVLSGPALERLKKLDVKEIITTNTLPISKEKYEQLPNMTILSIAPLLGEVILRAHDG